MGHLAQQAVSRWADRPQGHMQLFSFFSFSEQLIKTSLSFFFSSFLFHRRQSGLVSSVKPYALVSVSLRVPDEVSARETVGLKKRAMGNPVQHPWMLLGRDGES